MVHVKEHQKFCPFREQCWERDRFKHRKVSGLKHMTERIKWGPEWDQIIGKEITGAIYEDQNFSSFRRPESNCNPYMRMPVGSADRDGNSEHTTELGWGSSLTDSDINRMVKVQTIENVGHLCGMLTASKFIESIHQSVLTSTGNIFINHFWPKPKGLLFTFINSIHVLEDTKQGRICIFSHTKI